MIKINSDGKILLALAAVLLALTLAGVLFDRDSRARMDKLTARIEAEAAAEAERRAAIDALLTEVRAEPRETFPRDAAADAPPVGKHILTDYWRIAEIAGEDLLLPEVRYPPRLMEAHDRVEGARQRLVKKQKDVEAKTRAEAFDVVFQRLAPMFWASGKLFIRPARNEAELKAEGVALKHCVGSYAHIHAKGKEPIFLIRRAEAPDEPYFTLQLDVEKLEVIQNRRKRNCDRTKEVTEFENAWLKHLREMRRAEAKPRKQKRAARDVAGILA